MYKAFKYKLKPTNCQEKILIRWMGSSRWIWNWCITSNKETYKDGKRFIFKYDLKLELPNLKKLHPWLKEAPSQALQNRILDFDSALRKVWKQGNGFPKYKSKHIESHNTIRIDQIIANGKDPHIKPNKTHIKIPKMGWVKWTKHRPLEGKLKNITIKQENNQWWIICLCDIGDIPKITKAPVSDAVGVDMGLTDFAILSDETKYETPKLYHKQRKKLKKKQQILARRSLGSANYNKAKKKLNNVHFKTKCQRQDFTHKASTQITKKYNFICVEDLNIKGMLKNKHLSKAISDQGWAMFIQQLDYKSKMNGGATVKVDRWAPSTKTCSSCGNIQDMPLSQRTYKCNSCGLEIDRDINASYNIRRWGIDELNRAGTARIYACEDASNGADVMTSASYVSVKQEKSPFIEMGAYTL